MGVATVSCAVSGDMDDFVDRFKQELQRSGANAGVTDMKCRYDVDRPENLTIDIQWENIETARKNFEAVRQVLEKKVSGVQIQDVSCLRSNVGP